MKQRAVLLLLASGASMEYGSTSTGPLAARAHSVKMIIVVVAVVPLALDYAHQSHTPALAAATRRRRLHFTFYTLLVRHIQCSKLQLLVLQLKKLTCPRRFTDRDANAVYVDTKLDLSTTDSKRDLYPP
jgi:predicted MFS family arabinose efflux permease